MCELFLVALDGPALGFDYVTWELSTPVIYLDDVSLNDVLFTSTCGIGHVDSAVPPTLVDSCSIEFQTDCLF